MKKVQAEPGLPNKRQSTLITPIPFPTLTLPLSFAKTTFWIGNGRTVLNNKGNAVKQYEPYLSVTHKYEDIKELVETGVTPIMYYDAMGRLIKTEMPDTTFKNRIWFAKTKRLWPKRYSIRNHPGIITAPTASIDAELIAEGKDPARENSMGIKPPNTPIRPNVQHFDTLGSPVLLIEHNKNMVTEADEFYHTK